MRSPSIECGVVLLVAGLGHAAGCGGTRTDWGGGNTLPGHPDAQDSGYTTALAPPESAPPVPTAGADKPGGQGNGGDVTYTVGAGARFPDLNAVSSVLKPGDVVELMGNMTYKGGVRFFNPGEKERPIVIRGVTLNGKRPVLEGGAVTLEAAGSHYVFENLELTGGENRCFFHHADNITLRDSLVHDCTNGILGADQDSGSLTIEGLELWNCGSGERHHGIYMATDERAYPGSVFTLRNSYLHDGLGGNLVKSRSERNEIQYNWIEGSKNYELELIGPDTRTPAPVREDSQVIGNVLRKTNNFHVVRIGGDGTGDTAGRYRFLHNTFVLAGEDAAIRVFDRVESLELYNNAFVGKGPVSLLREGDAKWVRGTTTLIGAGNWFSEGPKSGATFLKGTKQGGAPRFAGDLDFTPGREGALFGVGVASTPTHSAMPIEKLQTADFEPPKRKLGPPTARAKTDLKAAGAFEVR